LDRKLRPQKPGSKRKEKKRKEKISKVSPDFMSPDFPPISRCPPISGKLVKNLMADRPPEIIRIGNVSTLMPLMKKWLPTWLLYRILKKKFGLG